MSKEKQIEELTNELVFTSNYGTYNAVANYLVNKGYRKQEWISVEDRLPEEKVNCLVHYKHAYCDNDGYWAIGVSFYDGHEFHTGLTYKVTHWMPLPKAPKMKGVAKKIINHDYRKQSKVVRCKDCEHFYQDGNIKLCRHWNCHSTEDDAYCSYAKMKGGAE